MSKAKTVFRCGACGAGFPKWGGRCASCGEWNTLVEERVVAAAAAPGLVTGAAVPLAEVDLADWRARPTGVGELDRVLGGGLVPGSVTVLGGEPGIGKSTLLLQVLAASAHGGGRALLVSGEESAHQVRLRAERLGALHPDLWLASETLLPAVLAHLDTVRPDLVVVDSIQTLSDPALASPPGSVGQVRECAHALVRLAKERGVTVVLVGHVTKEGSLAGPRVLEHVVDTVLSFEGDRHHALRLLRAVKHRFGATGELGLFEMAEQGLLGVADAGGLFLTDRRAGAPGSVVVPAMEGQRPLLVEVQALVTQSSLAIPRRSAQGLDGGRLALLLAVLEQRAGLGLGGDDVFASAVGGVRLAEPAADLALALAVASAASRTPVPAGVVAVGEVGLAGEVRQVAHLGRRVAEAARLGFDRAVVPASTPAGAAAPGITLERVGTLAEAMRALDLAPVRPRRRRPADAGARTRPSLRAVPGHERPDAADHTPPGVWRP